MPIDGPSGVGSSPPGNSLPGIGSDNWGVSLPPKVFFVERRESPLFPSIQTGEEPYPPKYRIWRRAFEPDWTSSLALRVPVQLPFLPTGEEPYPPRYRMWRRALEPDWTSTLTLGVPAIVQFPFIQTGEEPYPPRYRMWRRPFEPDWAASMDLGLPTQLPFLPTGDEDGTRRRRRADPDVDNILLSKRFIPFTDLDLFIQRRRRQTADGIDISTSSTANLLPIPFTTTDNGDRTRLGLGPKARALSVDLEQGRLLALLGVVTANPFAAVEAAAGDRIFRSTFPISARSDASQSTNPLLFPPPPAPPSVSRNQKQFVGEIQQIGIYPTSGIIDSSMGLT